jgi:hypothetical protein
VRLASRAALAALVFGLSTTAVILAGDDPPPDAAGKNAAILKGDGLVKALKESPGCLGVETARTASGKSVIFAFFENKKALMKWYFSPTHRELIESLGADYDGKRKPMEGVPDDVPVMAVASIKFGGKPASDKTKLPVSQISIELYAPVTKGLSIGGGFAPDAFRALGPKPAAKAASRD